MVGKWLVTDRPRTTKHGFRRPEWQVLAVSHDIRREAMKIFFDAHSAMIWEQASTAPLRESLLNETSLGFYASNHLTSLSIALNTINFFERRAHSRIDIDAAYCLLGLFDVFMPPIYGEGDQAHMRLLKEILAKESEHQTRLEQDKAKKRMSEVDMDRELAAEEQASEMVRYVSRLVRYGFSREKAIQRLARKWQARWGVSIEKATADISQFLAVLEYRSAWAREGMDRLIQQGNAKATAVRYLELDLQKYGYSPVDAYEAVRVRLRFKPIVESPANDPFLGAVREEEKSESIPVAESEKEVTDHPSYTHEPNTRMTDPNAIPELVGTEVSRPSIETRTGGDYSSETVTQHLPVKETTHTQQGSETNAQANDNHTDSEATSLSAADPPHENNHDVQVLFPTGCRVSSNPPRNAADSQENTTGRVDASMGAYSEDSTDSKFTRISFSDEDRPSEDVQMLNIAIRDGSSIPQQQNSHIRHSASDHHSTDSQSNNIAKFHHSEDVHHVQQERAVICRGRHVNEELEGPERPVMFANLECTGQTSSEVQQIQVDMHSYPDCHDSSVLILPKAKVSITLSHINTCNPPIKKPQSINLPIYQPIYQPKMALIITALSVSAPQLPDDDYDPSTPNTIAPNMGLIIVIGLLWTIRLLWPSRGHGRSCLKDRDDGELRSSSVDGMPIAMATMCVEMRAGAASARAAFRRNLNFAIIHGMAGREGEAVWRNRVLHRH
ncbi:uncharacterized protein MYCFIDRAFT_175852 [Pseudocercospora fijiensis CIRAD86]|uniref:Uncharacterized protein n=1 Tax=Pseudocercospora fijiensis (strain CIRAD86) TaxID=383855 RepID=M2YX83_PSEFD|nr:uncharacterized protein MYCFIDRAFT_175852 [Pseudocercospora fijiensis CIRAD86]EME82305.1 hypothetical protein MYCFIDRAFT_175852 [Pseudocercospora fijiensis CIRAD86]